MTGKKACSEVAAAGAPEENKKVKAAVIFLLRPICFLLSLCPDIVGSKWVKQNRVRDITKCWLMPIHHYKLLIF